MHLSPLQICFLSFYTPQIIQNLFFFKADLYLLLNNSNQPALKWQCSLMTTHLIPVESILPHRRRYAKPINFPMILIERNYFMENFWPALHGTLLWGCIFFSPVLCNEHKKAERYYLLFYLTFLWVAPITLTLVIFFYLQVFEKSKKDR